MKRFYTLFVSLMLLINLLNTAAAQDVLIPDAVLAGAVREALDLAPDAPITQQAMLGLTRLVYRGSDEKIADLTGLEHAINLTELSLLENQVSDLTPLWNLTNLTELDLWGNQVSDLTPLVNLTNLTTLQLNENQVSDLTPLWNLTNLTELQLWGNQISDATSVGNLTRLTKLNLGANQIIDITPLGNLSGMTGWLNLRYNQIIDVTPLENLTQLTGLYLRHNQITDITPLANLTNLTGLGLSDNQISDITALTNLTNLMELRLTSNQITDVSPLVELVNLELLRLAGNPFSDTSPLAELLAQNPELDLDIDIDLPRPWKITGPWLWMIAPTEPGHGGANSTDVDSLADASGGTVTETAVATNGAAEGDAVGALVWTLGEIAATGRNNINDLVNRIGFAQGNLEDHSAYALITLESTTVQSDVTMRVGSDDSIKVWLNGEVVHKNAIDRGAIDYQDIFAVNLIAGDNLLLVKVSERSNQWTMFVGIEAEVTAIYKPPTVIEAPPVDVNGDGQVNVLDLVLVALFYGTRVSVGVSLPADVNADGIVNILDLTAVTQGIDAAAGANRLSLDDVAAALLAAAEQVAEAPTGFGTRQDILSSGIAYRNVAAAFADAKHLATNDVRLGKWVPLLEELLQVLAETGTIPEATALLPNYPNPFNPETWMPYHLATDAEVILTIYNVRGSVVRELTLGHQPAGVYESRERAAYWDGRNAGGEPVASGVYFYTLTAGDFTATRKMLIKK